MKNSVDIAIAALETALSDHRQIMRKSGATDQTVRASNNAIGTARAMGFAELNLPVQAVCNDKLLELLRERSQTVAAAVREQRIAAAKNIWQDLHPCDIRRQVAYVARHSPDGFSWPVYEKFLEIMKLPDNPSWKDHYYRCGYVHFMYLGKWAGWWELSWDVFPDNEDLDLYNIMLVTVSLSNTEHKGFASLLADLGLFKSSSEAKKNGWNKPIEKGDFFFKKKTYILRIVE